MSWPIKKLGELCEIKIGKTPRRGVVKYWVGGTLPWATISEVNGGAIMDTKEKITETAARELRMTPFLKGTILYTFKLSIGRVGTTGVDLFTNEAIAGLLIKSDKNLLPEWLFYVLPLVDYRPFLSNAVKGNTLNKQSLKLLPIPLPPLAAQKQIVERLDKIAEAQKLNDELVQKSDELFQSLLHKELNPAGKNWGFKKLGELITDTTNGFASRPVTDGVGQLRPNNVDSDGSLNLSSIKFVPKNYRNIKNYFLRGGDILFNNTNSVELVGKTAFIGADYDYVFSNHMTRIRVNKEMIVPKFLAIFLQYFYSLGKFRFLCTPWVNQAAVNSTALKRIKIPLPPLPTQKQIVAKLSAVQDYKTRLLQQKTKLKELFDSALHKSFQGAQRPR